MSDMVLVEIISKGFWILIVAGLGLIFHKEIGRAFLSLSSLKLAGATIELKNKAETLQSYVLLAETFIDFLSRDGRLHNLLPLFAPAHVEKIESFALKYATEVPKEDLNEPLLHAIAYLLIRSVKQKSALQLLEVLLKRSPDHPFYLNDKALAHVTTRIPKNVRVAADIWTELISRFPEEQMYRFNRSLCYAIFQQFDDAVRELQKTIDAGYWRFNSELLSDPLLHPLREREPTQFAELEKTLARAKLSA